MNHKAFPRDKTAEHTQINREATKGGGPLYFSLAWEILLDQGESLQTSQPDHHAVRRRSTLGTLDSRCVALE